MHVYVNGVDLAIFQSLFIIFYNFFMNNGPTQLQLYQVISAPTGPILLKLVSNSS